MDRLPEEIFSYIVECMDNNAQECKEERLHRYAPVSQRFQDAIERRTFRSLRFGTKDLPKFRQILKSFPRRLQHMRSLSFFITYVSRQKSVTNWDEAFSNDLLEFFSFLSKAYATTPTRHSGIEFTFGGLMCSAKRDPVAQPLKLLNADQLPQLPFISKFNYKQSIWYRVIKPSSLVAIAQQMPNAGEINLTLDDYDEWSTEWRRKHRDDLAQSLPLLNTPKLTKLALNFRKESLFEEGHQPQDFTCPHTHDALNLAINSLSTAPNLRELSLSGVFNIAPEFFQQQPDATTSSWPRLQKLSIEASAVAPDGSWYFTYDPKFAPGYTSNREQAKKSLEGPILASTPGYGFVLDKTASTSEPTPTEDDDDDDDDEPAIENSGLDSETELESRLLAARSRRTWPDAHTLDPLVTAASRAAAQMPRLRKFRFHVNNAWLRTFKLEYVDRQVWSELPPEPLATTGHARVIWNCGDWRPSEEVEGCWGGKLEEAGRHVYVNRPTSMSRWVWEGQGDAMEC